MASAGAISHDTKSSCVFVLSCVYQKQRRFHGCCRRPPADDHCDQRCYNCTPAAAGLPAVYTVRFRDCANSISSGTKCMECTSFLGVFLPTL